jgi:hypothetical protein
VKFCHAFANRGAESAFPIRVLRNLRANLPGKAFDCTKHDDHGGHPPFPRGLHRPPDERLTFVAQKLFGRPRRIDPPAPSMTAAIVRIFGQRQLDFSAQRLVKGATRIEAA